MASPNRNRVFFFVASSGGLPFNETTFAETLQNNNYSTALIGKWHLGNDCRTKGDMCHHPLSHGFDYFYGLPLTNLKDYGDDGASVVLSYYPNMYMYLSTISVIGVSFCIFLYHKKYKVTSIILIVLFIGIPGGIITFQRNITLLNSILMRNNEVIEQPVKLEGMTDRLVNEASKFIINSVAEGKNFLVVLNFIKVHTGINKIL